MCYSLLNDFNDKWKTSESEVCPSPFLLVDCCHDCLCFTSTTGQNVWMNLEICSAAPWLASERWPIRAGWGRGKRGEERRRRLKTKRWDEFCSLCSSGVQNNKVSHNSGDIFAASRRRTVQSRADSNLSAGKCAYIGIFTQGRSKLSELLAALLWFTGLDGDLCTLRAVVNPVGTCLELANHLELKSAQMEGDKEPGGLVEWSQHIWFPVVYRLVYWLQNTLSVQ